MKTAFLLIVLLATPVFAKDPLSALLGATASYQWIRFNSPPVMGLIPETPVQQADIASAYGALGLFNGGASDLGGEPITMPTLPPFQQVFRPYRSPEPAYHPLTRITCELDPDCPLSRY